MAKKQKSVTKKTEKTKYNWAKEKRRDPHEKPKDLWGASRQLLRSLRPYAWTLVFILVVSAAASALNITGPMFLGTIVDTVKEQVENKLNGRDLDFSGILRIMLTLMVIYGGASILQFIQQYTMSGVAQYFVRDLREQVNRKLSKLPLKYFDSVSKGDILSRMMNDIDNISNTVQHNLVQILSSVVSFAGMLTLMFVVSTRMTGATLGILPPSLLVVWLISRRSRLYFRQQWSRMGELNGHIEEMYTGHQLVKVFNHEQKAMAEFDEINRELARVAHRAQFISGMIGPILGFVGNLSFVIICVYGGYLVLEGRMSLGDIISFFMYTRLLVDPVVSLGNIANNLQSALASSERVFTLIEEEEEPADTPVYEIEDATGEVSFEDVSFRYVDEKPLIDDLNIQVSPGKLIALVGPTGAGKTTIVNLLMHFYDICAGKILVDGRNIYDLSRGNLRKIFGMVLQDTWLFEGSIRDNIAYGKQGATDEEIEAAAEAARVRHFLHAMPEGMDTVLEENGSNISQGQRQLLTIARALLADPAVLILDEATSSVDTRTEILIQQATQTLMKGRTSFVIAHRLSTIRNADMILVMDEGGIVETGTHKELLAANGVYTRIYNSQFGIGNLA